MPPAAMCCMQHHGQSQSRLKWPCSRLLHAEAAITRVVRACYCRAYIKLQLFLHKLPNNLLMQLSMLLFT